MELFKLNDDFMVDLNKEWIQLHEPFRKIYLRDKGNTSNHYKGRFKFQAQKEEEIKAIHNIILKSNISDLT